MSNSTVESHIFNTDDYWSTSQFRASALTETVKRVHFCAHANVDNEGADGQPPTNHWSLFLEINTTRLVCVDMTPGNPHSPGMLILDIKDYGVSDIGCVYDVSSEVPVGTSVGTILQVIIDNKLDQYIFSPIGEGCRFWLSTFAMDLARVGLLSNDMAQKVSSALAQYWMFPAGSGSVPRIMQRGSFF